MTGELSPAVEEQGLSWNEIWIQAVTQPTEESYLEIVTDPGATSRKANTWVFLAALVGALISSLLAAMFGTSLLDSQGSGGSFGLVGALICAGPVTGLLAVLSLLISSGIIQSIARMLGGEGERANLAFGMAAYLAPISLVSSVFSSIPILNYLGFLLAIYALFLNVVAVKAVNKLSWGKSVLASLGILLVFGAVAVIVILILALLGPAIGSVFNSLQ